MKNTLQEFKDYIYKLSEEPYGEIIIHNSYWLQNLIPNTIYTETEAIEYLFHHQDLVENYIKKH